MYDPIADSVASAQKDATTLMRTVVMGSPKDVANHFLQHIACHAVDQNTTDQHPADIAYRQEAVKNYPTVKVLMVNYHPDRKAAVRAEIVRQNAGFWVDASAEAIALACMEEYLPC